jgi:hypothetical protein
LKDREEESMEEASDSSELFPERERRDAAYGSASRCACSVESLA